MQNFRVRLTFWFFAKKFDVNLFLKIEFWDQCFTAPEEQVCPVWQKSISNYTLLQKKCITLKNCMKISEKYFFPIMKLKDILLSISWEWIYDSLVKYFLIFRFLFVFALKNKQKRFSIEITNMLEGPKISFRLCIENSN